MTRVPPDAANSIMRTDYNCRTCGELLMSTISIEEQLEAFQVAKGVGLTITAGDDCTFTCPACDADTTVRLPPSEASSLRRRARPE